jgi:SAM-dependent methyltransferase
MRKPTPELEPARTSNGFGFVDRPEPVLHVADARPESGVDHVWANVRAFLPGGTIGDACQLGGDRLGPHLARFAVSATVIGPRVSAGKVWSAVVAPAHAAPFPDDSFDVVVVEDLGAAGRRSVRVLEEAFRLCRPSGTVVAGFRPLHLRSGARRLLAARSDRILAALPGPRRPAFIVDPRDRRSAGYFVRHMAFAYRPPGTAGVLARLHALRSRAAMAVPPGLALRAAPGRIAVVAAPGARPSVLGQLDELVRSRWSELGMAGPAPERLQPLVVGHRRPDTGVVTVLLFPPRGGAPIVAKFPRYGDANASLQREEAQLRRVSDAVTAPMRSTLPRSLGLHTVDGIDVLLQTGVPGRHLVAQTASKRLRPARVAEQLDTVLSWCLAMQRASAHPRRIDDGFITSRLESLASAAVTALDGDPVVSAFLDRTLDQSRGLVGTTLPMVVAHGDYWAGNILVTRGRVVGVVDWERATTDDLPIWDPVKAVGSAAYHLDRYRSIPRHGRGALRGWGDLGDWSGIADAQFATGFRAAFVQPGWLADTSRDALVRAFTEAGIPLGWLPVAVTFYLVRQIVQAGDSPRSIAGWGSVLRALAARPGTWADDFASERNVHGSLDAMTARAAQRTREGEP